MSRFFLSIFLVLVAVNRVRSIRFGVHDELGTAMHPNPLVGSPKSVDKKGCHEQFQSLCPNITSMSESWTCLRTALDQKRFSAQCNFEVERGSPCLNDAIAMCSSAPSAVAAAHCLIEKQASTSLRCQRYLERSPSVVCSASVKRLCPAAKSVRDEAKCIRAKFPDADDACKTSIRQWRLVHMRLRGPVAQPDANAERLKAKRGIPLSCLHSCTGKSASSPAACLRDHFDTLSERCKLELSASVRGQCVLFVQRTCSVEVTGGAGVSDCIAHNWSKMPQDCQRAISSEMIAIRDDGTVAQRRRKVSMQSNADLNVASSFSVNSTEQTRLLMIVGICAIGAAVILCILLALFRRQRREELDVIDSESQGVYALVRDISSI